MLFHCPQKADKTCSRPVIVYDVYLKFSGLLKAALPAFCTKQKLYIRYCPCNTIYRPPKREAYIVVASTISYILHSPCLISIFYLYTILPFLSAGCLALGDFKKQLKSKIRASVFRTFFFFRSYRRLP